MQLVEAYKKMFIGSMYPDKLLKILQGEHGTIYVRTVRGGKILLSDGQVIKCVGEYYERESRKTYNNLFLACRNVRKDLGLDTVGDTSCQQCHIRCLLMEQNHELKRKKKHKK